MAPSGGGLTRVGLLCGSSVLVLVVLWGFGGSEWFCKSFL